ncbi:MAG: DNA mismatch repair protein MutS [Chloroflexi bacterium]|nr:DNA mismatch repair protein MutS [Chloroflexota bacterium]
MPNVEASPSGGDVLDSAATPVRRQYLQIKRRFPDTILLFRLGDFYETFEQDAELAARVLDIVLTSREMGKGVRVPMAGIPHHAADGYIARLVAAGHKVAICEQIGGPDRSRPLIDRDVTRIVTPGTVTDPAMLDSRRNSFIAAVAFDGARGGIAYADLSTGEFAATQLVAKSPEEVRVAANRELLRLSAVEVVLRAESQESDSENAESWLPPNLTVSRTDSWHWKPDRATETLLTHFAVQSLDGFGLSDQRTAVQAAGALLAYLADTQRSALSQIASLHTYSADGFMVLDFQARRNLELAESSRGEKRHGLLAVLDETRTPMGARLLRRWLGQPLLDLEQIHARQTAVQQCVEDALTRVSVREVLGKIGDIERLTNRAVAGTISPRELGLLRQSLHLVSVIAAKTVSASGGPPLEEVLGSCHTIHDLLSRALPDDPPATLGEGHAIRPGFAPELDDHDQSVRDARAWIAGLERQERERTGIRSLKVGYNRVFGYYIEISATALAAAERERAASGQSPDVVPEDYLPRQSLTNGTRYVTARLKEAETRVLGAQEILAHLEADLVKRIVAEVAAHARELCTAAAAIAYIDVIATLAEAAATRDYVRPHVDDSLTIEIVGGRHPTLETLLPPGEFVPNDTLLDAEDRRITILTGPNMAGKSSWLRQTALIVLMAQIGSFVPAAAARIGLVDRIFTRIGAQDDISSGQSTFMVEMIETANILHHATPRSLVLLDEIGRGTSTWDGLAIARAVVEYVHNATRLGCRTLFATHFHEITALADHLPSVCCARMDVLEEGDRVVFLHRVVPGGADRSYGIHVAELAGVPRALTRRAREILSDLEQRTATGARKGRERAMAAPAPDNASIQLTLFAPPSPVVAAIQELDVESLSPLEALTKLYELKRLADGEGAPET